MIRGELGALLTSPVVQREKTHAINIIKLHDNERTIAIAIAIAIILIVARYCGDQQNHIRPIFNERISYHMAPTQFDIRFITFDNSLIAKGKRVPELYFFEADARGDERWTMNDGRGKL